MYVFNFIINFLYFNMIKKIDFKFKNNISFYYIIHNVHGNM